MSENASFSLSDFMPYLLNQAAEATSLGFQTYYKQKYGMQRTEWRVLFHLGRYGDLTAKMICGYTNTHKTKVSRAVAALEARRFLIRQTMEKDRRHEVLSLTKKGVSVFQELVAEAQRYNANLMSPFTSEEQEIVKRFLIAVSDTDAPPA